MTLMVLMVLLVLMVLMVLMVLDGISVMVLLVYYISLRISIAGCIFFLLFLSLIVTCSFTFTYYTLSLKLPFS